MAIPWFRILDAALGIHDLVRPRKGLAPAERALEAQGPSESRSLARGRWTFGGVEARLAGAVIAALKEAFDRDARRLELERQQIEAERRRMARALRLELVRQAGDREIGRLRLVAGLAAASFAVTLLLSTRFVPGGSPWWARLTLAGGWAFLLAAIAHSFAAQASVARTLEQSADESSDEDAAAPFPRASNVGSWLVVTGLALVGLVVVLT